MENKVLETNLNVVKKYNSQLADKILTINIEKSNLCLLKTEKDEFNIALDGFPLHNPQCAVDESKRIVENIDNKSNKNIIRIVYGLGLGYLLDELADNIKEAKIIVYEPNLELLRFVFEIAQIDALYKNNVFLVTDKSELRKLVGSYADENTDISITFLNSYRALYESDIVDVLNTAHKVVGEKNAIKNTTKGKGVWSLRFLVENLDKIIKNPEISSLKDIYKGKTAIVVSAGTSLKENIEELKKNKDNAVIFSINQAIKVLNENGIMPDFVVDIDAFNNTPQFKGFDTQKAYFILDPSCHSAIYSYKTRKTFNYTSKGNFYNWWLRDMLNITHDLETAGTVAYCAFMSAYYMGFEKIILIGQDLAYKDGKCYAQGCVASDLECFLENDKYVIKPTDYEAYLDKMQREGEIRQACKNRADALLYKLNNNICTIKGQNGKLLPTNIAYSFFIDYFEAIAKVIKEKTPNVKLINSSIGGAQINGFETLSLNLALENSNKIEKINLDNIEAEYDENKINKEITKLLDLIIEIRENISHLDEINRAIVKEIEIKKIVTLNLEKKLKKQKECITKIFKLAKNGILEALISKRIEFYKKVFEDNYANDTQLIITTTKNMLQNFGAQYDLSFYINALTNCKSIVSK